MSFRANVPLVSLLFAVIVFPHLGGCAPLALMLAQGSENAAATRHVERGNEYSRQAAKTSDDIWGLGVSIRLLTLAETEYKAARRELAVQRIREELQSRRNRLAALEEQEKALSRGRHLNYVTSARNHLANGYPSAAFRDITNGEQLVGDSPELATLRDEVRAAFTKDPSKIATKDQVKWVYNVLKPGSVLTRGLSIGDVFEGVFFIEQRFDLHLYRARFGNQTIGVEVV